MDGVLVKEDSKVERSDEFLDYLRESERSFLVLTNNSLFSPRQVAKNLADMGLHVSEDQLWTSALATARFLYDQRPGGRAFVIGEESLHEALEHVGYVEESNAPDYVVLGETWNYSYDDVTTAVRLIERGARFVATNPERTGADAGGIFPGCGSLAALIQSATGVVPYFVGKPNPVMIRDALNILNAHSKSSVMIGDRMDTDIRAGVEAGLETILVLSGFATREDLGRYPFQPSLVVDSVADLFGVV